MKTMYAMSLAVLLAGTQAVYANPWEDPDYLECGTLQTTVDIVECLSDLHDIWDGRLNSGYREAMEFLPASRRAGLQEAQRAWIAFRDADCAFPDVLIRGSLARIYGPSCLSDHTMRRVVDLRGYLGVLDGY